MQLQENKKIYISDEEIFSFQDTLLDNISFKVFVQCSKEKFLQYQKDILEEFVADFTSIVKNSEELDAEDIREIFEQSLQLLNTKLKQFAEKVRDVDHFSLKGIIQLVVDDKLMSSMIGNVSMIVMRDQKTAYSVPNSIDNRAKIDLFSDFIEGNIERDDQILYVGLKFADVMDAHDLKEMENILAQEESADGVLSFLEELLTTRVDRASIGFVISYFVQGPAIKVSSTNRGGLRLKGVKGLKGQSMKYISAIQEKIQNSEHIQNAKKQLSENKIYLVGAILVILIFIFLYALASQILSNNDNSKKFKTPTGTYVDIDLEELQNDIAEFKTLDASSNLKTIKYAEISQKLNFLEEQGKWLEDIQGLKSQLQENYYDGFRIIQMKTSSDLNNVAGRDTQVLSFNSTDLDRLGTLNSINVPRDNYMMIAGNKGAIIGASSDTSRGTLQPYNLSTDLKNCITSLNTNGLYCYDDMGDIYMISKSKITPVTTEDGDFRSGIGGLGTYLGKNLYVFQSNVSSLGNMLLTRYQTNSDGTYANFKGGSSYSIDASGVDFGTFSSFSIDDNFYGISAGTIYQFWRDDLAGTSLRYRKISVRGSNPLIENYSDNVKVIASKGSKYMFTFDRNQQLLTVYNSDPSKTNNLKATEFQLVYLFSIKFDIEGTTVYDIDIPDSTGNRPELYLLTSAGVNRIPLYEYIETLN